MRIFRKSYSGEKKFNQNLRKIWKKRKLLKLKKERTKKFSYAIYLKSKRWAKIRDAKFREVGRKCEDCGSTHGIQVHHLTYKRIFKELLSDLLVLCSVCHRARHDLLSEDQVEAAVQKLLDKDSE